MDPIKTIRNLGIMAHIDAGKTTVTERLLFVAGRTHKMGEVHDGLAVMDWMELERERGITITSAVTRLDWRGHALHLVDTPGHVDFTIEVERSLRVLDGAVAVLDAAHGVEPQTETVWRQADRWHVPRVAFVNKMDRVGADFDASVASLRRAFADKVIAPLHRPLGAEASFAGMEDLVARRTLRFHDREDPRAFTATDGISAEGESARRALVEAVADLDDPTADAVLSDRAPDGSALSAAIRRVTLSGRFVPVLCGSALRNVGIPQLLDAICDHLPSPLDVAPPAGTDPSSGAAVTRAPDPKGPLLALAFKVSSLDEGRRHVFLRVYAGRVGEGDAVWNASLGKFEKVSRVLLLHAAQASRVPAVEAGEICAVLGLKEARTGDTLTDKAHPLVLEPLGRKVPVISQSIEPDTQAEREPLLQALARLADEDPTFAFGEAPDTGQLLVSGMGELHLEIAAERLRREFKLRVRAGQPQVLLHETITAEAEAERTFERALPDGESLYACARVRVRPLPRGQGVRVAVAPEAAALPFLRAEVRRAVEEGAREAAEAGVLQGDPLQDLEITLLSAAWREGASKPFAYKVATAEAVRAAAAQARPALLEPLAEAEVVLPAEHLGEVIGSLDRRRGTVLDVADRGHAEKVVRAEAPLRRMFGYATELRSLTKGRASFTLRFARYDLA